jgi:predicted glycosyltransferase
MNNQDTIHRLIQEILLSNTIDEKRTKKNQVIKLFKEAILVKSTPVVVRLNNTLALQEAIDNFIVHDNYSSRQALTNTYSIVSELLVNDFKAA